MRRIKLGGTMGPNYLRFWGKARGAESSGPVFHPVAYHSLDVAAAADELLIRSPRRLSALARLAGTDPDNVRRFLVAMIALHDVGKFARTFQAKAEHVWPRDVLGEVIAQRDGDHAAIGSKMRIVLGLRQSFKGWTGRWNPSSFDALWHAVAGHHGRPKVAAPLTVADPLEFTAPAVDAARSFVTDVLALFPEQSPLSAPRPGDRQFAAFTWAVAGLTVCADWIGSNSERWFPYTEGGMPLRDYWREAKSRASRAVSEAGLLPVAPSTVFGLSDLLPPGAEPSPLQSALAGLPLPDGPALTIVEDVTGSGKTEAALILGARLVADRRADGLFIALPTMATANAMYERAAALYRGIFAADAAPSLVLAHGKRNLNDRFTGSILGADGELPPPAGADGYDDGGAAVCAAWIADDRRRVFLAHVGVGTVDQALLAVLPSKHQSLRLWGLADRVLVLDEVHSYDAYMSREIETLLEFHAALGGSAILLSATLPARQRQALEAAFARGLGVSRTTTPSTSYPLVTVVAGSGTTFATPATRQDRTRTVPVRRIGTASAAVAHLAEVASAGGCVAWIRNAVDDAIEACETARALGLAPVLLHSRFAMGHRLAIEDHVRRTLGRRDQTGERKGFVLIGTQILEASLDYDVDAMVTDLAPVDLMIQRAGRLWRHADRKGRPVPSPELVMLAPDPEDVGTGWYGQISPRGAFVYQHHGIIWRSAKTLFEASSITTPEGIRGLIEAVYGPDRLDLSDAPAALRPASTRALGQDSAARSIATSNLLELVQGYAGNLQLWTADTITPTRLGEPVTTFRLATLKQGRISPLCPDGNPRRAWALSELTVASRRLDGAPDLEPVGAERRHWPDWERAVPVIVLKAVGDSEWVGEASRNGSPVAVHYSCRVGLKVA